MRRSLLWRPAQAEQIAPVMLQLSDRLLPQTRAVSRRTNIAPHQAATHQDVVERAVAETLHIGRVSAHVTRLAEEPQPLVARCDPSERTDSPYLHTRSTHDAKTSGRQRFASSFT
jgi:hypothetical protein